MASSTLLASELGTPQQAQERAQAAQREADSPDPYNQWQARSGASDEATQILRDAGVPPAAVASLTARGVSPDDIALNALEYGPRGVEVLDALRAQRGR